MTSCKITAMPPISAAHVNTLTMLEATSTPSAGAQPKRSRTISKVGSWRTAEMRPDISLNSAMPTVPSTTTHSNR
jgi:hypothetical protein